VATKTLVGSSTQALSGRALHFKNMRIGTKIARGRHRTVIVANPLKTGMYFAAGVSLWAISA
jgi:hypothetical protein